MAVKRTYQSEIRTTRARATRDGITVAARRLFASRGYAATSIAMIAKEAGVAVQTVYAVFGNKRAVLESLLDTLDDQAGLEELGRSLAQATPPQQAAAVARFLMRLFSRGADVIAAGRSAGTGDPALRALARKGIARHHQGMTRLVQAWERVGALRAPLTAADAVAILNAITSYEVFQELRSARWTLTHYEEWLGATIAMLVLE
ncbi:MAG: helix-turn-helix domain-containing protein, partial [Vicinamibacterales bacterium]